MTGGFRQNSGSDPYMQRSPEKMFRSISAISRPEFPAADRNSEMHLFDTSAPAKLTHFRRRRRRRRGGRRRTISQTSAKMEGAIEIVCVVRERRERERATWKIFSHCTAAAAALIQKLSKPEDASSIAKGDGGKQLKGLRPMRRAGENEIEKSPLSLLPKIGETEFFCTAEEN